jgi:hypothetical protein
MSIPTWGTPARSKPAPRKVPEKKTVATATQSKTMTTQFIDGPLPLESGLMVA